MTSPAILLALLSVLFLSANGTAQYLNRAVYLGRDGEGIRRDFSQNPEYLLTRYWFDTRVITWPTFAWISLCILSV